MLQLLQGYKKEEVYVFLSFQRVCQKISIVLNVRLLDSSFRSASPWVAQGRSTTAQSGHSFDAGWELANCATTLPSLSALKRSSPEVQGQSGFPISVGHWPLVVGWGKDHKWKNWRRGINTLQKAKKLRTQRGPRPPAAEFFLEHNRRGKDFIVCLAMTIKQQKICKQFERK